VQHVSGLKSQLQVIGAEFAGTKSKDQIASLIKHGSRLPQFPESDRCPENQVMGCTSQVWLTASLDRQGKVAIAADSDSIIAKGLAAVLISLFQGLTPQDINDFPFSDLDQLSLGPALQHQSRTNAFGNMFRTLQKRCRALLGDLPRFPSLLITAHDLVPQGLYAEAQARFLMPDAAQVACLVSLLQEKRIGVVAHFYMDPEVQGVLSSAANAWPHISISGASSGFRYMMPYSCNGFLISHSIGEGEGPCCIILLNYAGKLSCMLHAIPCQAVGRVHSLFSTL
jgi:quinolinate synthase